MGRPHHRLAGTVTAAVVGELLPAGTPLPTRAAAASGGGVLEDRLREWLLGYGSVNTRDAYRRDPDHWLRFLTDAGVDPLTEAQRLHAHAWLHAQEAEGASTATRARRLAAVSAFHAWLIAEDYTDRANPAAIDPKRKPRVNPYRTSTAGLTKEQAGDLLAAADADTGPQALRTAAIVAVLLYTASGSASSSVPTSSNSATTAATGCCASPPRATATTWSGCPPR